MKKHVVFLSVLLSLLFIFQGISTAATLPEGADVVVPYTGSQIQLLMNNPDIPADFTQDPLDNYEYCTAENFHADQKQCISSQEFPAEYPDEVVGTDEGYYIVYKADYSVVIAVYNNTVKTQVIVVPDELSKVYGEAEPEHYTYTLKSQSGTDLTGKLDIHGELMRVVDEGQTGKDVGTYDYDISDLILSEAHAAKYELVLDESVKYTITPKEVTLDWTNIEFTYNGKEQCPTAAVNNLEEGDSCAVTVTGGETNAGTYTATADALDNDNYSLPDPKPTQDFTIGKDTVYVSPNAASKTFGDEDPAFSYEILNGNNDIITTKLNRTGELTRESGEDKGTYNFEMGSLALTGQHALNYDLELKAAEDAVFTIEPKTVKTIRENVNMPYTGEPQLPTVTYVDNDGVTKPVDLELAEGQDNVNVGKYQVLFSISDQNYLPDRPYQYCNITPAELTVEWVEPVDFDYDGEEHHPNFKVTGCVGADAGENGTCTDEFVEANITAIGEISAGIHTTNLHLNDEQKNYTLSESGTNYEIRGKEITLVWDETNVNEDGEILLEYNGDFQSPSAEIPEGSIVGEDTCTLKIDGELKNVKSGRKKATASLEGEGCDNYIITNPTAVFRISPKTVDLSWEGDEFPYTGEEQKPAASYEDVNGSLVTVSAEMIQTDPVGSVNAGEYTASAVSDDQNYQFSEGTSTHVFSITAKAVTIIWEGNAEKQDLIQKEYNGTKQYLTAAFKDGDIAEGDNCILTVSKPATNVSDGQVQARADLSKKSDPACKQNYVITDENRFQMFEITPLEAVIVWDNDLFTYNGEEQKPVAFYDDVNGSQVTVSAELIQIDPESSVNVGEYTATVTALSDTNYKLPENPFISFEIEPAEAELIWSNEGPFTYNGDPQAPTAQYKGLNDELFDADVKLTDADGNEINEAVDAGDYTASASIADGNYTIGNVDEKDKPFTINKGTLTVVPTEPLTKRFGELDPTPFNYQIVNVKGKDVRTGVENAGSWLTRDYTIDDQAGKLYDFDISNITLKDKYAKNYALVLDENIKFQITDGVNEITHWPSSLDKVYNGSEQTLIDPVVAAHGTVMYSLDKQDWSDNLPAATDVTELTYYFYVDGGENYSDIMSADDPYSAIARILPAPLTVTPDPDQTKEYGEADPEEFTYTVSGNVEGETPVFTGALKRAAGEDAGTYFIRKGDLALDPNEDVNKNYVYEPADGFTQKVLFTITPRTAVIDWDQTTLSYTYDGTEHVPTAVVNNLVEGDVCDVTVDGAQKDAGVHTATATGLSNSNYVLPEEPVTTEFVINPAVLTVTPVEGQSKVWDGNAPEEIEYTVTGAADGDDPAFEGELAIDTDVYNAGEYAIVAGTLSLSDPNYSEEFTFTEGVMYTINKALPSITTAPAAKNGLVYNGNPQDLLEGGIADGGTLMYFFKGEEESETPPQGTDAGEYRIYYYVKGDENHEDLVDETNQEDPHRYRGTKVTIAPAEVIVTADDKTKVYGEDDPEWTATVEGLQGEDTEALIAYEISRAEGDNVGEYVITPSGEEEQGNYVVSFETGTLTITKAQASITTAPSGKTGLIYNGEPQDLIEPGEAEGGDIIYFFKGGEKSTSLPQGTDAGEYRVYYYVKGDDNHEDLVDENNTEDPQRYYGITVTIAPAEVTVTADDKSMDYLGEEPELTATVDGLQGEDTEDLIEYDLSREEGDNVGEYVITPSGEEYQGNYHVTYVPGTLTIGKVPAAIVTDPSALDLTYNGEEQTLIDGGVANGGVIWFRIQGEEEYKGAWELPKAKDAGDYVIEYYIAADDNHTDLGSADDPLTMDAAIKQAEVTVTADDKTKVYGEDDPEWTAVVEGLQGEDTEDMITYELNREEGDDAGEYAIIPSGEESQGNYVVSFENGKLTITKAQSSITKNPSGINGLVYNGEAQDLIEPGEAEGGDIMYFFKGGEESLTPPQGTDAGEYRVYYYVKGDKNHEDLVDENNAEDPHRYNGIKVVIAQADVTVTADDKTKVYGEDDPELTVTIEGLQGDDTEDLITYEISREEGDDAGEYVITPSGEESQGNYVVSFETGKLTITKAPNGITKAPAGITGLVYNGEPQDLVEPGEAEGGKIMYFFKGGEESEIPPQGTDAGEYRIYYYVKGDDNHEDLVDPTNPEDPHRYYGIAVTIAPAEAVVKANDITVTYGDEIPELSATVTGLFGEDTVDYTLSREEGTDAGTYAITPSGEEDQGNYHVTFEPGTLTIEPYSDLVTVTIVGESETWEYTGEEQTLSGFEMTSDNELYSAALNVQYNGEGIAKGTTVGEYPMGLVEEDFVNTSANFTNVKFDVTDGTLTIEPLMAEIEWSDLVKYYNGEPQLPTAAVSNLKGEDECEVTVVCYDEHVNAGTYRAFATGLSNENYKLDLPSNAPWTDYEIREKLVEVVWSETEKEYNGQEQVPTAEIKDTDIVSGETCTVVVELDEGPQKDAGEYTARAVSFAEPLCEQNYSLSDANITTPFTITPKTVDLTWTPDTDPILFSFDGQPHRPDASYTDVEENTVTVADEEMTVEPEDPAVNYGTYTVKAESADKNYVFSEETSSKEFQIVAKIIVVVPDEGQGMTYGSEEPELTYTLQDEEGNTVSEPVLDGQLGHDGTTVGSWPFNMGTLALKPEDEGNYTLTLANAEFTIDPKPVHVTWGNTELTYNGEPQVPVAYVPDEEIVSGDEVKVVYSEDSYKTDAGDGYTATVTGLSNENYVLAKDAETTTTFNIAKADLVPGVDFTVPQGIENLNYNGQPHDLITEGTGKCVDEAYCTFKYGEDKEAFESEMITKEVSMSEDIPQGTDAGTYTIYWMVEGDDNHNAYIPAEPIKVRIAPTQLDPSSLVITPRTSFVYDGLEKRVEYTVINSEGTILTEDVDYEVVKADTRAFDIGTYEIIINGLGGYRADYLTKTWEIIDDGTVTPFDFHRITSFWDGETNCPTFGCGQQLPATGFPTRFRMPLSVRPDGLKYEDLGMKLQIPVLAVNVDLVGVPQVGQDWAIEWLGANAGILSGTSEPGRGYTMIAGHNHLNESEMGPFLNLGSLKQYDTIYITLENGMNLPFSVYANELIRPDDYQVIAKIAAEDPNSIVLVTCENESAEGGYLNRRVVFAKPF